MHGNIRYCHHHLNFQHDGGYDTEDEKQVHLIGDKDYHQGAFAIIDVEAEVRSHARLRVDHLQMKEDKKQIVNIDKTHKQKNKQANKQTNKQTSDQTNKRKKQNKEK